VGAGCPVGVPAAPGATHGCGELAKAGSDELRVEEELDVAGLVAPALGELDGDGDDPAPVEPGQGAGVSLAVKLRLLSTVSATWSRVEKEPCPLAT
jgi:hypothetical protein